jgi:hypothetical protein
MFAYKVMWQFITIKTEQKSKMQKQAVKNYDKITGSSS